MLPLAYAWRNRKPQYKQRITNQQSLISTLLQLPTIVVSSTGPMTRCAIQTLCMICDIPLPKHGPPLSPIVRFPTAASPESRCWGKGGSNDAFPPRSLPINRRQSCFKGFCWLCRAIALIFICLISSCCILLVRSCDRRRLKVNVESLDTDDLGDDDMLV